MTAPDDTAALLAEAIAAQPDEAHIAVAELDARAAFLAQRRRERLAEVFAAGYAVGQALAVAHPMSEERRARLSLLISPDAVGPARSAS